MITVLLDFANLNERFLKFSIRFERNLDVGRTRIPVCLILEFVGIVPDETIIINRERAIGLMWIQFNAYRDIRYYCRARVA